MSARVEDLAAKMQDGRLINISEQVLFPLLQKHIDDKVSLMCSRFREGQKDFIRDVAQISYIKELYDTLRRKQTQGNKARKDLEDGNG